MSKTKAVGRAIMVVQYHTVTSVAFAARSYAYGVWAFVVAPLGGRS